MKKIQLELPRYAFFVYLFSRPKMRCGAQAAILKLLFLDVGQGDAIYAEFPGGNFLVDAGKGFEPDKGRLVVEPFLKSKGVRSIDLVIFSHPQEDHIGGMEAVFDEFRVRHVLESGQPYSSRRYQKIAKKIVFEKAARLTARQGDRISGFENISLEILNPPREAPPDKKINNDSLVLRVSDGSHSFLLTGDIEKDAMKKLLTSGQDWNADILKVPHHGAKIGETGKEFLGAVSPQVSVISVGARNPFGHPKKETLAALEVIPGNRIFRTDVNGAVEIMSSGKKLEVSAFGS